MTQETAESQSNLVVLKTLEQLRKSIRCSFRYDVQMSTPRDTTNMRTIPDTRLYCNFESSSERNPLPIAL